MITIKKAKITSMNTIEIEYEDNKRIGDDYVTIEMSAKPKWEPHSDLLNEFKKLRPHLVRLCEEGELPENEEQLENYLMNFRVTGYVIGGKEEHEGVTLIGRKELSNGRVLNLIAPFTKWEDQHNPYDYATELLSAVDGCSTEVTEYLHGKKQPAPQLKMAL